jgi:glycosyltransferase involved in cell wall biosynthesis
MPTVSIIIPSYNRAALLAETVESARRAGSDLEVIIVDDASTDNTPEVCAKFADVRYLRLSRNRGLAEARNIGVLASSAEFVAFLDDDDLRLPGTIDRQVHLLQATPDAALVYGRVLIGDARRRQPTGQILPLSCPQGDVFWDLLEGNFIQVPSVLVRRECLVEIGLFRSGLQGVEDWDAWLRLAERFPIKAVEEAVAVYRCSNSSSSQMSSDRVYMFRRMMLAQKLAMRSERARAGTFVRRRKVRRRFRRMIYETLSYEGACAFTEGDTHMAREYLRFAFRLHPFRAPAIWWLLRVVVGKPPVHPSIPVEPA